jgi:hypothetical protein
MIKLKQVLTENAEIVLLFEYDQEGKTLEVKISYEDIRVRLKQVKDFLGRSLLLQDAKLIVIKMINEVRAKKLPLLERFDFNQFIGVDLEG